MSSKETLEALRENRRHLNVMHLNSVWANSPLRHLREAEDACRNVANSLEWAQKILSRRAETGLQCFPVQLIPLFTLGTSHNRTVKKELDFASTFALTHEYSPVREVKLIFEE